MGLNNLGRDNWKTCGAPATAAILQQSALDVYFLQEVDATQMNHYLFHVPSPPTSAPLNDKTNSNALGESYETIHFAHPTREAGDGVAIAVKKSRFHILESTLVPYETKVSALDVKEKEQLLY